MKAETLKTLAQKIHDECDLHAYVVSADRPSLADFCEFIAKRMRHDLSDEPTEADFTLTSPGDCQFDLEGSATVGGKDTPITGEFFWLPSLDCFRGRIRVVPPRTKSQLRHQALIEKYRPLSQDLSAEEFYFDIRDDGVSLLDSALLLKNFFGHTLSEVAELQSRYDQKPK